MSESNVYSSTTYYTLLCYTLFLQIVSSYSKFKSSLLHYISSNRPLFPILETCLFLSHLLLTQLLFFLNIYFLTIYRFHYFFFSLLPKGSCDSLAKVWDIRTGSCTMSLRGHESDINSVMLFPDGKVRELVIVFVCVCVGVCELVSL